MVSQYHDHYNIHEGVNLYRVCIFFETISQYLKVVLVRRSLVMQWVGYLETRIFYSYVHCVLAQTICFKFCKHGVQSKLFLYLLFLEGACWIQC